MKDAYIVFRYKTFQKLKSSISKMIMELTTICLSNRIYMLYETKFAYSQIRKNKNNYFYHLFFYHLH